MVPTGGGVARIIEEVYELCRADTSGTLADYIPELAAVQPDSFGICLATADGRIYGSGDLDAAFTIQSISKPFTYALALADQGPAEVARRIDVEPTGEPFNEISLDPQTQRPRNPMINAGAIAAAGLVTGIDAADRFARIRRSYSRFAGRELTMNEDVYASEARTGYRNRAIGYLLRGADIIDVDPDEAVDRYFRQCSIDVTCRDLAVMAATLANNGVNPLTRERALTGPLVQQVLSVMTTCGMYDAAGDWVTAVGLPAKSGVGGGILAVLPGQIGIAVYSPRLDANSSSVRGVKACRELSTRLGLHFLHVTRALDLKEVGDVSPIAVRMLEDLRTELAAAGCPVGLVDPAAKLGQLASSLDPTDVHGRVFIDRDAATEWCEQLVLDKHRPAGQQQPAALTVDQHPALADMPADERERLAKEFETRTIARGELIVPRDSERCGLFLILGGRVRFTFTDRDHRRHRLITLTPGMSFGETSMLADMRYANDVYAETTVRLAVPPPARFDKLTDQAPQIKLALLERLAAAAYAQADAAVRAVSAHNGV
ncbi:glutaminase A [Nocardia sp. NPDC005746]|uniref:glutaminase A n=1 Tax=Nocardia sp. NPDC005746 TaxID=3157062 RepID=UPI0033FF7FBD